MPIKTLAHKINKEEIKHNPSLHMRPDLRVYMIDRKTERTKEENYRCKNREILREREKRNEGFHNTFFHDFSSHFWLLDMDF